MCYIKTKYDCGHHRRKDTICKKKGLGGYLIRAITGEPCTQTEYQRRHRLCSGCESHQQEEEGGREQQPAPSSSRKKSDKSARNDRKHKVRDHDGHRGHKAPSSSSSREPHHSKRSGDKKERSDKYSQREKDGSKRSHTSGSDRSRRNEPPPPPPSSHHGRDQHRGGPSSNPPPSRGEPRSSSSKTGSNRTQPTPATPGVPFTRPPPSVPYSDYRTQLKAAQGNPGQRGTTSPPPPPPPPKVPAHPPIPLATGFKSARAEWLPRPPASTYQPSVPPRPPSSVYPDAPRPPPFAAYSTVPESDFYTVYAESTSAVNLDAKTSFTHPSSVPEPLFRASKVTGEGRDHKGKGREKLDPVTEDRESIPITLQARLGSIPDVLAPDAVPAGKSRYAGLAATEEEYKEQRQRKERIRKAEEEKRRKEVERDAELRREQAACREAMEEWEQEQVALRAAEAARRRVEQWDSGDPGSVRGYNQELRQQQQQQQHHWSHAQHPLSPSPPRPDLPHQPTNGSHDRGGCQTPTSDRGKGKQRQSESDRWDRFVFDQKPEPTPSSVGSQIFMNPRPAPSPRSPYSPASTQPLSATPSSSRDATGSLDATSSITRVSDFLPRTPFTPPVHTVDPKIVKKSWGAAAAGGKGHHRPAGKRSESSGTSKSVSSGKSKSSSGMASPLAELGHNLFVNNKRRSDRGKKR